MEFAPLIKTPRVEKVIIHRPFHKAAEGALCITGHHLIFSAGGENPDELWVITFFCFIPSHLKTEECLHFLDML